MQTDTNTFKTYEAAIDYFNSSSMFTIKLGLERVKRFLSTIDNCQDKIPSIHIAGTNGKGSVLKFIENVLVHSGYKVGSLTSPHLVDYTERFCINGKPISQDLLLEYINQIHNLIIANKLEGLTLFEFLTVLAFKYFSDSQVDIMLLEVGLGGRYDATNVIGKPLVGVFTSIDYDHIDILGDTIEKIAYEKAGILKKDAVFVIDSKNKGTHEIIKLSKVLNSKVIETFVTKFNFSENKSNSLKQDVYDLSGKFVCTISLAGKHQQQNFVLAYETLSQLKTLGYSIPDKALQKGFETSYWSGRCEYLSDKNILLDAAHNESGALALRDLLDSKFEKNKRIFIIGILDTKDAKGILQNIIRIDDIVVLTKPPAANALNIDVLEAYILENNLNQNIIKTNNVQEAYQKAKERQKKEELIVITGSLYTLGAFLAINQ